MWFFAKSTRFGGCFVRCAARASALFSSPARETSRSHPGCIRKSLRTLRIGSEPTCSRTKRIPHRCPWAWVGGSPATLDWKDIKAAADSAPPRDKLLYANFGTASNPAVREPLKAWLDQPAQSWITREPHAASGKQAYLRNLFSHRFVLCPPGNGEDTHRMWEALYCGAIPVVRESSALRGFRELPCVSLPDLRECTEQVLLSISRAPAASRAAVPSLLETTHWAGQFARAAEPLRQGRPVGWRLWFTAWWQEANREKLW